MQRPRHLDEGAAALAGICTKTSYVKLHFETSWVLKCHAWADAGRTSGSRCGATAVAVAGRYARGVRPRLEPLGEGRRDGAIYATVFFLGTNLGTVWDYFGAYKSSLLALVWARF